MKVRVNVQYGCWEYVGIFTDDFLDYDSVRLFNQGKPIEMDEEEQLSAAEAIERAYQDSPFLGMTYNISPI